MTGLKLSAAAYQRVFEMSQAIDDVRVFKRAQALLWLHEGETYEEVAERLHVTPRTLHNWVKRYQQRAGWPLEQRLGDAPRSGRPAYLSQRIEPLVRQLIDEAPEQHGYPASVWTAPLLREHLHRTHQIQASERSIHRTLQGLGLRWKRPRHRLARRSPTWRQAKGG